MEKALITGVTGQDGAYVWKFPPVWVSPRMGLIRRGRREATPQRSGNEQRIPGEKGKPTWA